MIDIYRSVTFTVTGESDEDIRNQVKDHFAFVDKNNRDDVYHITKLELVKFLKFKSGMSLIDSKFAVEEYFGEP